jgi:hypothetical protein
MLGWVSLLATSREPGARRAHLLAREGRARAVVQDPLASTAGAALVKT